MAGLPRHRGLGMAEPVGDEMEDHSSEMEEMGGMEMDPPPRRPAPPDQGGEDFDPTDPAQKPKWWDSYSRDAEREARQIQSSTPDGQGGDAMMEWRRRWLERARKAGLDERQASHALDMVEDSL